MVRHLAALDGVLRVAEHVVHVRLELHAAPESRAELAVTRENPVLLAEHRGGTEDRCLFAERADVEADTALSLQRDEALIQHADEHHVLVDRDDARGVFVGVGRGVQRAVVA